MVLKTIPVLHTTVKYYFSARLNLAISYAENLLHFNFADFPAIYFLFLWCLKRMLLSKFILYYCLHYIIPRILHNHITEELIFHADEIMVMGNSKNSHVFNFEILLCFAVYLPCRW